MDKNIVVAGTFVACATCCAPLIVPVVWPVLLGAGLAGAGGGLHGWLAGLPVDTILCAGVAIAALAGGAVWMARRAKAVRQPVPHLVEGAQCAIDTCRPSERRQTGG